MTITTTYKKQGIDITLVAKDDIHRDISPYDLAYMFSRVIRDSELNPELIIEQLKNEFEYDGGEN